MAENPSQELILLLREIEQRSRQNAADLPESAQAQGLWEGILFKITGTDVVAPLDEVKEILTYPSGLTPVPGAKRWLVGISNVRGNLLPVVDLQVFLGGQPIVPGKRSRVLVINFNGHSTGLLVGNVQGMKHFTADQRVAAPTVTGPLGQYLREAFKTGPEGDELPVFSMRRLSDSPGFQVAAA
jgi:twitching motility protein PilI